mgnify:FL=1
MKKEWENIEDSSWQYPIVSYIDDMKEKVITIKPKGISTKQYSSLLLELNLVKQAWRPYGVDLQINAPGLKNVLKWGTKSYDAKE